MSVEITGKLQPVHHQTAPLRSKIIATLRNAIETGVLQPGARLIERDLCEQLNVSRTSLREALRELEADGVLAHTERGLVVDVLSRRDAENIYRIRAALESLLIEQFIHCADQAEVERLEADGVALKSAYRSGDVPRILAAKRAFYDRICLGAQNALAFDIINRLVLRTSSLRVLSLSQKKRQQQSIKEIELILEAIRERDLEAARAAAVAHVENSARSALGKQDEALIQMPSEKATSALRRKTRMRTTN